MFMSHFKFYRAEGYKKNNLPCLFCSFIFWRNKNRLFFVKILFLVILRQIAVFCLSLIVNFVVTSENFEPTFLITVKLNADPEFKVHFDRGPNFIGLKWAKMREKSKKWIFWKYFVYKLILITDYYTYYKALYNAI